MKIFVSKSIFFMLFLSIILACDEPNQSLWVTKNHKRILSMDDKVKIFHSGIPSFCDEFEIKYTVDSFIILKNVSRLHEEGIDDFFQLKKMNKCLLLDSMIFHPENLVSWDSIVIRQEKNRLVHLKKEDNNLDVETLALILKLEHFEMLDTSFVAHKQFLKYELWEGNRIIASKISANNFLCLDIN